MDRISWNEYFMNIAILASLRSKDPNTKVGAVFVSEDNKILSTGYNGAPRNYDDNKVNWNNREPQIPFTLQKYPYICHAELNAVVNYGGAIKDFKNSTLYVTMFPCNECAKLLAQLNIKRVYYLQDKYHEAPIYEVSRKILDECGIAYIEFKQESNVSVNIEVNYI